MLEVLDQAPLRQTGHHLKELIEAELLPVPSDEVEDEARFLARRQPQSAPELLLEEHRALRRPQEEQGVDVGQVDAFVVQVAGADDLELDPLASRPGMP